MKRTTISESGMWLLLAVLVIVLVVMLSTGCKSLTRMTKDCVCDCTAQCGQGNESVVEGKQE